MRVVLFVGHKGVGTGATWEHLDEHELAHKAAISIGATLLMRGHDPFVVTGQGTNYIEQRVSLAAELAPDCAISCHFNAHDSDAHGCEVLYHPHDTSALGLAMMLGNKVADQTEVRQRHPDTCGAFPRPGLKLLRYMKRVCPTVILEPLFLTSAIDRAVLDGPRYWQNLARAAGDALHVWRCPNG